LDIPRVPIQLGEQADWSFEEYQNQGAKSTTEEAVSAASELAWNDTALGLFARRGIINELQEQGVTKITPEEANNRHPNMRVPFRESVSPLIAQMRADQEADRDELIRKINNGPDDGWSKTKVFGAGMVAHLMDPVEFGAGAFIGWGIGGLAARGALGARVTNVARGVQSGTASTATRISFNFARESTGNLIQNVGQELGQNIVEGKEGMQSQRTGPEILTDIAIGTFAASVVGTGVAEGAYNLKGIKNILRSTSPEADLAVARTTISALETELRPNVNPIIETLARETSVLPQDFGKPEYKFEPVTPDNFKGKVLYATTRDAVKDLRVGDRAPLGDDFGFGVHLTDNPGVANAAAVRSMADNVGAVHSVELDDLKPIYLDATIPDGVTKNEIYQILKDIEFDDAIEAVNTESARTLFDYIKYAESAELVPPGTLADLQSSMKADGYNALVSDGSKHLGYEHTPHNHVTVLDENLIKQKATFEPDRAMVKAPSQDLINNVVDRNSDKSQQVFSEKGNYEFNLEQIKDIQTQTRNDVQGIRSETESMIADFEEQVKQGLMPENIVKALKESIQDIEDEHSVLKAFANCVRG
jgi:hypothetical protein